MRWQGDLIEPRDEPCRLDRSIDSALRPRGMGGMSRHIDSDQVLAKRSKARPIPGRLGHYAVIRGQPSVDERVRADRIGLLVND